LNSTYNTKAQAATLMMSKAGALSHTPGTNWPCYTAAGDEAAGNSNLYLGRSGPDAISGYMRDPGSGNSAVGHRRWILLPQTQQMGTGDIPSSSGYSPANALWVFDSHTWDARPATRNPFVAWPPAGDIPYPVVFARWSFAYPNADFTKAKVSLSKDNSPVSVTRYDTVNGYGDNTLVWIIGGMSDGDAWPKPSSADTYTVSITGAIIGGKSQNFIYAVTIFDPNQ
ncbi:MAG: CAP domain-containing protein, partial [Anaerolineaceae bacterium]|nr:CAP domain-containing protein [Anaerolineaceae bacterium]